MISGGLMGMPRRTLIVAAPYYKPQWRIAAALTGIGGTLMFVGPFLVHHHSAEAGVAGLHVLLRLRLS